MNEIIALGLPGVTCLLVLRFIRRDRTKTGWDYLLLAGLLGALSFAISRWLIYTVLKSRYPELVSIAQDTVAELFGARPYLPSYIGSFFVAIGLAYCIQISIVLSQQRHVADLIRFFFVSNICPGIGIRCSCLSRTQPILLQRKTTRSTLGHLLRVVTIQTNPVRVSPFKSYLVGEGSLAKVRGSSTSIVHGLLGQTLPLYQSKRFLLSRSLSSAVFCKASPQVIVESQIFPTPL